MNFMSRIKEKLQARTRPDYGSDGQDLQLYRELRRAESGLYAARERLSRSLAQQQSASEREQPVMRCSDELEREIDALKSEVARLEIEYENVQRNVRSYFYQETCPGRVPANGLTAGHPAQ